MTGRRLYDLVCDGWAKQGKYQRTNYGVLLPVEPLAWPFLSSAEQSAFSNAAARIKPTVKK